MPPQVRSGPDGEGVVVGDAVALQHGLAGGDHLAGQLGSAEANAPASAFSLPSLAVSCTEVDSLRCSARNRPAAQLGRAAHSCLCSMLSDSSSLAFATR